MDVLADGVDYLCSLRVYDSHHGPVQKYTDWWVCSGGERSWRRTKITEPRQERMGLESNVCAGGIFWTRSNSSWQGECCHCQHYIKLAYREETLIRPFEWSLHFFLLPMGSGRVLVVKGKQRYGDKRKGSEDNGGGGGHKMFLEIIKLIKKMWNHFFFAILDVLERYTV